MSDKKIIAVVGATGAQGGGVVRAILADPDGPFTARVITRNPDSPKAQMFAQLGLEIVTGDSDDPATLGAAFKDAYGAFLVTNFWEHFSADREGVQAANLARAASRANLQHIIWSTLENTLETVPLHDDRLPTLQGKYKVPHFDGKVEGDRVLMAEGAPATFLLCAFYWENFIYFGAGPKPNEQGELVLTLPLGGVKLPGICAEDIGRCAYGVFKRGTSTVGQRVGIAGEILSGEEMAAGLSRALDRKVTLNDLPFDVYRGLGFPGADDLGNMFQYQAILGDKFLKSRDVELSRSLNPALQSFDEWLAANAPRIPIE